MKKDWWHVTEYSQYPVAVPKRQLHFVHLTIYSQDTNDAGRNARGSPIAKDANPAHRCRLTHKFAKTGRYASEEENGEDMCQIQAPISFREFKKIVWERAIRNSAS